MLLACHAVADVAPIAVDLDRVPILDLTSRRFSLDVGVVERVGLRHDFGSRFRPHFCHVFPQLLVAPKEFGLETLVYLCKVLLVALALDFAIVVARGGTYCALVLQVFCLRWDCSRQSMGRRGHRLWC